MYVQRAALNGEALDRLVLTHAEIVGNVNRPASVRGSGVGGVLELWMGLEPQVRGWGMVQGAEVVRSARSGEEL